MNEKHAVTVIKRRGKRSAEPFQWQKLFDSIYTTCLSVRSPEGVAKDVANRVCDTVVKWAIDKPEITSTDIRHQAVMALEPIHPDAAQLYKHHKLIM